MGKRPPRRTQYENELANLLQQSKPSCHVTTSGNNQGWDITLFKHNSKSGWNKVVLIEVKTSIKPLIYFKATGRQRKQKAHYKKLWTTKRIVTWYAYRIMVGRHKKIIDKWRFFHIDDMGSKMVWDEGISYKKFVEAIR